MNIVFCSRYNMPILENSKRCKLVNGIVLSVLKEYMFNRFTEHGEVRAP